MLSADLVFASDPSLGSIGFYRRKRDAFHARMFLPRSAALAGYGNCWNIIKGLMEADALFHAQNSREVFVSPISCGRCTNWADSPSEILKVFKGQLEMCENCGHKKLIVVAIRQLQSNHPRWWVVDGKVVVPIWVQERLRNELFGNK